MAKRRTKKVADTVAETVEAVTAADNGAALLASLDGGQPEAIVFDLDGTLCETDGMDYMGAKPISERIAAVNALYDAGVHISIDTARGSGSGESWQIRTQRQLEGWGLRYHELRCGVKLVADVYVDDRGVNAGDWLT